MDIEVIRVRNVAEALPKGLRYLAQHGVAQDSRNGMALVAPGPVITVYEEPWDCVLLAPLRDANPFFHLAEVIWMMAGRSDAAFLTPYVKDFGRFAEDDGVIHGAYGYRWRNHFGMDQLKFITKKLWDDPGTRQAVLQMWDASGEPDEMSATDLTGNWRDRPCNTHVYFRARKGALDMTVCCRSNDMLMGCLSGDTPIKSPEGDISIKSLSTRFYLGLKKYPVYAVDPNSGDMAIKWCSRAWKTGVKPVIEFSFDDGSTLRLTRDHKLYKKKTRRGLTSVLKKVVIEIEAGDLKVGDRIWAPWIECRNNRAQFKKNILENTSFANTQLVYKAYDEFLHGPRPHGIHVHHKDENVTNDREENLVRLTQAEHTALHARARMMAFSHEDRVNKATAASRIALQKSTPEQRRNNGKKGSTIRWSDPEQRRRQSELMTRLNLEKKLRSNHKIVAIRELPPEDVYDFTVEDYHTALVGNGVLAHNCYGANAVHFAFLHEYVSAAAGLPQGHYAQMSNDFHAYETDLKKLVKRQGLGTELDVRNPSSVHNVLTHLAHDMERPTIPRTGGISPTVIKHPDVWLKECESMCAWVQEKLHKENSNFPNTPYESNHFLVHTIALALVAHLCYRLGDIAGALSLTAGMGDPAWRAACTEWLQRRMK